MLLNVQYMMFDISSIIVAEASEKQETLRDLLIIITQLTDAAAHLCLQQIFHMTESIWQLSAIFFFQRYSEWRPFLSVYSEVKDCLLIYKDHAEAVFSGEDDDDEIIIAVMKNSK